MMRVSIIHSTQLRAAFWRVRDVKLWGVGVCLFAALAACHRTDDSGISTNSAVLGKVTTVSTPTGVGTAPMFALSSQGDQAMVWISAPGGGTDGRLYVSINGAAPSMLTDPLASIEAHSEAPPRVMFGPDGSINALYIVGKDVGARFPVSAIRFVRSTDGGKTWSSPVTVTDDSSELGSHNFHSLYVAPDGTVYAAWLDGRAGKSATYFTYSVDGGRHWAGNKQLSVGETCPCCRTALAADAHGVVYAAWRAVFPGNVRDMVVARSADHGATWGAPVRVHADNWVYPGCPHAGPSMQLDSMGHLHVLWWTGAAQHAGVFYAMSEDGGKTFSAQPIFAQQVAVPSHVQLALQGGNVVATWDEMGAQGASIAMRVSRDGGAQFGPALTLSDTGGSAQYPVIGLRKDTAYVAWSQTAASEAMSAMSMSGHDEGAGHEPMKMGLHPVGATQVFMRAVRL